MSRYMTMYNFGNIYPRFDLKAVNLILSGKLERVKEDEKANSILEDFKKFYNTISKKPNFLKTDVEEFVSWFDYKIDSDGYFETTDGEAYANFKYVDELALFLAFIMDKNKEQYFNLTFICDDGDFYVFGYEIHVEDNSVRLHEVNLKRNEKPMVVIG